ncbi:MAG TPA: UDP-N-acetylmuramate dehydrogenase [Actinomycetes bacterium]|nr:UDP-N-acetylmuramate dehydrogenase [Actinomycetes bacterium]
MHELDAVPLSELTTLRLGGPARRLAEVDKPDELVEAVRSADAVGDPVLILGGGSNLVVGDAGFDGTVIKVATTGIHVQASTDLVAVTAQAGEDWDPLVSTAIDEGWAGLEAMSGIPGLVGATPIQNVGAYGQEVAETVTSVTAYDRAAGEVTVLQPADCAFSYRNSALKGNDRYVVIDVTYTLARSGQSRPVRYQELARALDAEIGDQVPAAAVRAAVLGLRRRKGMVLDPNDPDATSAGSFFTNPIVPAEVAARLPVEVPRWPAPDGQVKVSAAWLIERAGFAKGYGHGAARISTKHTLALTNRGGATTAELLALARELRDGVQAKFGITLVNEPVLIGATF